MSGTIFALLRREWPRIRLLLWALLAVVGLQAFVVHLSVVQGHSMEPSIHDKDWLLVSKVAYTWRGPSRRDVVILRDPTYRQTGFLSPRRYLVKRVVGLPGDRVEIRSEVLYVNGLPVREPYASGAIENGDFGPLTVPSGQYFVMGDNRALDASEDSRVFGPVPRSQIDGKALIRIWPPGAIRH